ncbi:DUF4276 family protein [Desulfonatronum sp. SC1]|uniref:DUF4276 family protein n=1 Tax=Desulfonatronum sp. SC1 TaxID=2109626 RepID=UPI0013047D5F|nr:DUF4276 family protein [Desulfonatronum sp. SC1]
MSRVLVLVEGPTERAIVDRVFAPEMGGRGVYLYPRVVGKPGHKGGNKFATVLRELKALLSQESDSTVTMLFDYYGLREDWPGLASAKGKRPEEIPTIIEPAIAAEVAAEMGLDFNRNRFIPYVQLHETESLLFACPDKMAQIFQRPELEAEFTKIVEECGGCEAINDDPETAPSKRIIRLFPGYKKGSSVNAHAHRIARHIGLQRMREQCPHFNEWMTKIEHLA